MSIIEHPCLILYRTATGLEKAIVDVGGGRIIAIPAELIRDMWDPWRVSPENLPVLAWAMQAQLWEDDWPENTKREWIAEQWLYQSLRGTRRGIEMALHVMGRDFTCPDCYKLVDELTAPQGFFAIPKDWAPAIMPESEGISFVGSFADVSRVNWPPYNAELLIDLCTTEPRPAWFADEAFSDDAFVVPNDLVDYDRALRALKGPGSATSLRDKIMVDFAVVNPLSMSDPIFEAPNPEDTRFGDHRPNWL